MKTQKFHLNVFIALLLLTCSVMLLAEPMGTAFTYQGRLLDDNIAADGVYDMQFTLYDDPNTLLGSQVGSTIDVNDMEVMDGYFIAELDFGSDVYGDQARWLQVAVRPGASTDPGDFVALSPLQQLTAAPYATSAYEVTGRVRTAGIYEGSFNGYNTWTPKESNKNWWSVAMSADGTIQTAVAGIGKIYVSTDTGNTWTPKESNRSWQSVAMSADGTIQTAVVLTGQIYVSTDTGNTWTPKESNRYWTSVAMSADGTIQTAVDPYGTTGSGGQIYVSTDTGNTWTPKESNRKWTSVAMSADGTIQTAVVSDGQIYVSTDTGNTWTPKGLNRAWQAVAMSADGIIQTAVDFFGTTGSGGQIYVSTDSGNTWMPKESNRNWQSVAMSADGTIQTAVVIDRQIYVSTDTGNTWTPKESNRGWSSVAMSADGTIQTAVVLYGQIYVSLPQESRVGIDTTNPAAKLDVNGTAKIGAWHDQIVSTNGYTWIGNILYQWATAQSTSDDAETFTFPIPFPNQCFTVNPNLPGLVTSTTDNFTLDRHNDYDGTLIFTYMAIGY